MTGLRRPVRPEEIQTFADDGVVWLQGILDPEWVLAMAEPLERALRSDQTTDMTTMAERFEDSGGERLSDRGVGDAKSGRFLSGVDHWRHDEAFRAFSCDPPLPGIAAALLDSARVFLWEDSVLVKEPGTREATAFHQDLSYFHVAGDQVCTFWVPLDSVDRATGTVAYAQGSHRWPELFSPNLFVSDTAIPGSEGEACQADPTADRFVGAGYDVPLLRFEAKPGDVVVHHARTVHGATGNRSTDRRRRAISVRYCGDDARYFLRRGAPQKPHHAHVKNGDPLGGEDCPEVGSTT